MEEKKNTKEEKKKLRKPKEVVYKNKVQKGVSQRKENTKWEYVEKKKEKRRKRRKENPERECVLE